MCIHTNIYTYVHENTLIQGFQVEALSGPSADGGSASSIRINGFKLTDNDYNVDLIVAHIVSLKKSILSLNTDVKSFLALDFNSQKYCFGGTCCSICIYVVNICMFEYIYIYVYMYLYFEEYIYIYLSMYIYTYVYVYIYVYIYVYLYIYMNKCIQLTIR
jgi:hypothetical protein